MRDLMYVSCDEPGYSRKGRGKGFEYFDKKGRKITDEKILKRIKDLVIPPNWKEIWISPDPSGHIQATGKDEKGRKQYLYHEKWSEQQKESKFVKMTEFAKSLPKIRHAVKKDLRKKGWPREKVLALTISILDEIYLRIGNKSYKEQNETYGLTTLRRKHVEVNGSSVVFQFKAKSGKYRKITLEGKKLTTLIKNCSQLPGYEVFQYLDENGAKHPVDSHDVNVYLKEISGEDFTAKDFRTWGGTALAVEFFGKAKEEIIENPQRKLSTCLVEKVAERLGNTVATCREYYIHPSILECAEHDDLDYQEVKNQASNKFKDLKKDLTEYELAALYLIEKCMT